MALRIEIFSEQKRQARRRSALGPQGERLYWIDSYGPAVHRADLNGGDRKSWSLPEPIGSMSLREKIGTVRAGTAQRIPFPRFRFGRGRADRRDAAGRTPSPPQRRQGRPARPFRRGFDGLCRERADWQALPARYRPLPAHPGQRHHLLQRSLLEHGRDDPLFRRQLQEDHLRL